MPDWVLGFEVVETSRRFARQVARIEPEWLEKAAPHLCRYQYSHPRWDAHKGAVYAREHVSCVGLRILDDRSVHLGRIHPPEARKTFILEALVPGDLRTRGAFKDHNAEIIAAVRQREVKVRKPDSLYCHEAVVEFFDERLPKEICTTKAFERWRSKIEADDPRHLFLDEEAVSYPQLDAFRDVDYPDEVLHDGLSFPIYYEYQPGEENDGITIACSLTYLNDFPDWLGEWLVPGYLKEKIVLLIKSLPKEPRIACQPIEKRATAFVEDVLPEGPLLDSLAHHLTRELGRLIEPTDFDLERLPPHLIPRYWIGDDEGQELASGPSLDQLRRKLAPKLAQWFKQESKTWEASGLTHFPKEELPASVSLQGTPAYPALIDEGKSVGIRCFSEKEQAEAAHRLGLVRLVHLRLPDQVHHLRQQFPLGPLGRSFLPFLGRGGKHNLSHLVSVAIDRALGGSEFKAPGIRDANAFAEQQEVIRADLYEHARAVAAPLEKTIEHYQKVDRLVEQHREGAYASSIADIQQQLDDLFIPGFLLRTWSTRLQHYPRYLSALETRLSRLVSAPPNKDLQKLERVQTFHQAFRERMQEWEDRVIEVPQDLREFGWQLQEFRVAVFAPEVGTPVKVSEKRLQKALESLA